MVIVNPLLGTAFNPSLPSFPSTSIYLPCQLYSSHYRLSKVLTLSLTLITDYTERDSCAYCEMQEMCA